MSPAVGHTQPPSPQESIAPDSPDGTLPGWKPMRLLLAAAVIASLVHGAEGLQLHVKAGPDGRSVGDCPFAHAIQIVCAVKKLEVQVLPHSPTNKPQWLVEEHGGKMPCLVDNGQVVTESRVIADYLEQRFPQPPLAGLPGQAAAEQVAGPVFGAFARYCKSTDDTTPPEEQRELKKALLLALCNLDAHLMSNPAPFVAGSTPSVVDAFLLPALYHIQVAGTAYKDFEIPVQFDALNTYMQKNLNAKSVKACTPPEAMVRWGWANARSDEAAAAAAEAELKPARARR